MVTVKELILLLKKMPQNLEVGVAMHDNSENEVAGWINHVIETVDCEFGNKTITSGDKCVVLRC